VAVGEALRLETLVALAPALARTFGVHCSIRTGTLDPAFAFDGARAQYYSTAILQQMGKLSAGARILGITTCDLYVPVLTFVFGEAQLSGGCALVSQHRLREEFYGLPPRPELLFERLVKESVHELGHTFGLRHCDDWRCVMASSHAVERLDVKTADFCGACRQVVAGAPAVPGL
jgi:archaemetzincin